MNTPLLRADASQMVLDHLGTTFGLAPASLDLLSLTPRDLPEGADEFYAEVRGSYGNDHYNCVVMGGKVYCSGSEGEFARLMREQVLLEGKAPDAAQLMRLYSLFALPREVAWVDARVLARDLHDWQAYPEVAPPALARRPDGGVTLTFCTTPPFEVEPSKWTVSVTRACEVEVAIEHLAPR